MIRGGKGSRADLGQGIPVDSPGAPIEGQDAGPSDDLQAAYIKQRVDEYRRSAIRRFSYAKKVVGHSRAEAEKQARSAIESSAKALWWAEDTGMADAQHVLMHRIGTWTRRAFGCYLDYDGGRYVNKCYLAIAHKKFGFSIGFVGNRICSICGGDLSVCPHVRGRSYWIRGGVAHGRPCAICDRKKCSHSPSRLYRVGVTAVIKSGYIREVSIVRRPAQPEARLTAVPVETAGLIAHFGDSFVPGIPISCDHCLSPCFGFTETTGEQDLGLRENLEP